MTQDYASSEWLLIVQRKMSPLVFGEFVTPVDVDFGRSAPAMIGSRLVG